MLIQGYFGIIIQHFVANDMEKVPQISDSQGQITAKNSNPWYFVNQYCEFICANPSNPRAGP